MGVDKLISRTLFIISIIFKRLLLSHKLMQPMNFSRFFCLQSVKIWGRYILLEIKSIVNANGF